MTQGTVTVEVEADTDMFELSAANYAFMVCNNMDKNIFGPGVYLPWLRHGRD